LGRKTREPSQVAVACVTRALRSDAVSERCYSILIGTNTFRSFPLLLRPDEVAPAGDYRWRMIAQTDDFNLAIRILDRVWSDLGNLGAACATGKA
jgi:hypothetical protein